MWIIYNPAAGPADVKADVAQASRFWEMRGWEVAVRSTQAPGHAAVLAQQAVASSCQLVIAAGGDGTVGQTAHGMAGSPIPLAVLPVGTANAFAKLLGMVPPVQMMPADIDQVCDRLARGRVQQVDLGLAHAAGLPESGCHFLSWAGTGLDAHIVEQVEPRPKWVKQMGGGRLGWLSYVMAGVPSAVRFAGMDAEVQVDDRSVSGHLVLALVSNSRLYGGGLVRLSEDSHLDDGTLDVWLFKGHMFPDTVGHAARLLSARHLTSENTIRLRGRHVTIRADQAAAVQLDGEPAGYAPLTAQMVPGALRLLVPVDAPADLFCLPGEPFAG